MSRMELQHAFEQGAATTRFERAPLWQAYPQSAQSITHSLSADPVFDWGSLADIIANGDRSLIEVREDTPAGRFKVRRDLPTDLRPLMAEQALASGSPGNNPRIPTADEIVELYDRVWA